MLLQDWPLLVLPKKRQTTLTDILKKTKEASLETLDLNQCRLVRQGLDSPCKVTVTDEFY